jgi:hypothetical protein
MRFHGSARNSIYSFERQETHTRVYQFARMNLSNPNGNVSFNTSLRMLTDSNQSLDSDQRFRAYNLNIKFKKLFQDRVDFTLGRQFLHPGTVLGGLDGVFGQIKAARNIYVQLYTGIESHHLRQFDTYSTDENFVYGGLLEFKNIQSTNIELFSLQKKNDIETFWQLAGFNIDNYSVAETHFRIQAHYDLQNEHLHRLLLSANRHWTDKFMTSLRFKQQYPQIYANSYFTIFEPKAYAQYKLGATFEFTPGFYLNGQYQMVQFDDEDNANRFFLTVNNTNGSIGMLYESGYAGDQFGLMFDYAYEIFRNFIASVYIDYSKYRTEQVYEYDNQLANAARLSYRINRHLTVDVEYQWLKNRFKKSDSRFLNHISYRW